MSRPQGDPEEWPVEDVPEEDIPDDEPEQRETGDRGLRRDQDVG